MDRRVLLFLLLVSSCYCCNARDLNGGKSEIVGVGEAQNLEAVSKNDKLCTLCEQFATEALTYLEQNKTQTEVVGILHKSCSKIPSLKQQCILLVDYYAPLFFLEVSTIQAEDFCRKVDLCEQGISLSQESQHLSKDTCDLCHDVLSEALEKLKDPDTELEIIQVLLRGCNSIGKNGKNVQKCKKLVFEYAPLILVNAEQFLETNDICTILHACDSPAVGTEEEGLGTETSMHAAS